MVESPWGYGSIGTAPALQADNSRFESGYLHQNAALAQLVEHLLSNQEVICSIQICGTISKAPKIY